MNEPITMNRLQPNQSGRVLHMDAPREIKRRLEELGLLKGTDVQCLGRSPLGDPKAYLICGAVIAIRDRDCAGILIQPRESDL